MSCQRFSPAFLLGRFLLWLLEISLLWFDRWGSPCPTMKISQSPSESDSDSAIKLLIGSAMMGQQTLWHVRPNRIGIGGNQYASGPEISCYSSSCKLRYPILSVMKCRDLKTNLEPGKNLFSNSNAINLT
jgi:hypothetical protein